MYNTEEWQQAAHKSGRAGTKKGKEGDTALGGTTQRIFGGGEEEKFTENNIQSRTQRKNKTADKTEKINHRKWNGEKADRHQKRGSRNVLSPTTRGLTHSTGKHATGGRRSTKPRRDDRIGGHTPEGRTENRPLQGEGQQSKR